MKTPDQIAKRLTAVSSKKLKKLKKQQLKCAPQNCKHNLRHVEKVHWRSFKDDGRGPVDTGQQMTTQTEIGLCMFNAPHLDHWPGYVCDDEETAKRCPFYAPKYTSDQIKAQFFEDIKDREWVSQNLPLVDVLLWVQDEEDPQVKLNESWFIRLKNWLRGEDEASE